ncbi:hypothetical protein A1O3_03576 [Capronia epimyces CBS 606.96]|uniref:Uncharacterized protein n=1 Tax=Capronia epimyces CBS 606.96 TaxID=1182542 RepID=W9Y294_9EURO|nr:uncharacterized protein A1O3_03576 [Capronia epimyces CBS 606.96]EXJ86623.1 hypothetical protein A1O3_03576 [Capronia epimyces CBS 606.96]
MFWEMILQDIQQFIIIVEAPGATYNENDKLVLLRLLERAETQFHRTTASWAQLANPQAPGSQPSLQGSIRRCIVPAPTEYLSEGLEASKTKLVNIDGRQLCMRKQHFDESYLDRKSTARSRRRRMRRRGMINSPGHAAQRPNPLSHFITAEDVQYPAFTQQEARWTLATLGKTPAYVCLSAFMVSVTAKYNWEGISHNHALSILKQLQERKDLLVRQDAGSEKTTVERRVQCLKAVLEKMAKEYDLDRKAFTQGISVGTGMADLGKLSRMAIPGQQDVKVVQELVAELLHGRS